MHKVFGLVVAIMFGFAAALAAGDDGSMSNLPVVGGAKILLAQGNTPPPPPPPKTPPSGGQTKPKKPLVMQTVPQQNIPPGAHQATQGQKGKCICSTNAQGITMCTGGC